MLYLFSTVISVTIGLFFVNTIKPGDSFSEEKKIELREKYSSKADLKINDANNLKNNGPLQFIVDIVPVNIIGSASENKNMLQIIFFAILFGIAIIVIPDGKTEYVRGFFDGVNEINNLAKYCNGKLSIMPGGNLRSDNINLFSKNEAIYEFHSSCIINNNLNENEIEKLITLLKQKLKIP